MSKNRKESKNIDNQTPPASAVDALVRQLSPKDIQDDDEGRFVATIRCSDCNAKLNETSEMTAKEIKSDWGKLVVTSGFNAGSCPNGCRPTFSDLNINTSLGIEKVA